MNVGRKSSPDYWMPLRLLLYVGEVYDWCRRQDPTVEKLPFVFPIVFYHGERKWNAPNNFRELVDIPEYLKDTIQAFVPDFSYQLEDLKPYSDEALKQLQLTACAKAVLSVLKHTEVAAVHGGIDAATEKEDWELFRKMTVVRLASWLIETAKKINLRTMKKANRGPKILT